MRLLRAYRALLVGQYQAAAQYRAQALLYLLFSVVRPIVFLAAWVAVVNARGGRVGGYDVGAFAGYFVALTLVNHLSMAWNAWEFEFEVQQGRLSPKLLRPLHPIHYAVAENIVWKVTTLVGLVPVLVLMAVTFGARFDPEPAHLVLFVPSLLLATALSFVFGWVVATATFWITRSGGLMFLLGRVAFIFSGQIAPLGLMPGVLLPIAYALPFGYMLGVPADILRGGVDVPTAAGLVGVQALWLVATYLALQAAWRAGLRRYSAVGA